MNIATDAVYLLLASLSIAATSSNDQDTSAHFIAHDREKALVSSIFVFPLSQSTPTTHNTWMDRITRTAVPGDTVLTEV